jgi:hypothetical protein
MRLMRPPCEPSESRGVPAFFFLVWESLNFALPSTLQKVSVEIFGIPILLAAAAIFLAISAWTVRYTQITYSAD